MFENIPNKMLRKLKKKKKANMVYLMTATSSHKEIPQLL